MAYLKNKVKHYLPHLLFAASILILLLMSVLFGQKKAVTALAEHPVYLYGMHDPGGEGHMAAEGVKGYIVFVEWIGADPNSGSSRDYTSWSNNGYGVIVRFDFGSGGTLPCSPFYGDFVQRIQNFVANSNGAHIWIVGNEPNLSATRPQCGNRREVITPSMYAGVFNRARSAIKSIPGHEGDLVLTAAIGPWNVESGDWIAYFRQILESVEADGVALHTYTHGTDPPLVFSNAKMDPPYEDRYYHFRAFRNFMQAIPEDKRSLPVYITETDQDTPWKNFNSGWVKNAYAEVNNWNTNPNYPGTTGQKIRALVLYRWEDWDPWVIKSKGGVVADWRGSMSYRYRWDTQNDALTGGDAGSVSYAPTFIGPGRYTGWANKDYDESDYYSFSVLHQARIEVALSPPKGIDYNIYLYNPAGVLKAYSASAGDRPERIVFTADSAGEWRLFVFLSSPGGAGWYTFSVEAEGGVPAFGNVIVFQAEDYAGGASAREGTHYHDLTPGNSGGAYRNQDVDIETTADAGGGYNVGWIVAGEWLKYQFTGGGGAYRVSVRYATPYGGSATFEIDGINRATINLPATGGWQNWSTAYSGRFYISSGSHTLRVKMNAHNFNLNWLKLLPVTRIQAEDYIDYLDAAPGNSGGAYRNQDVDIETTADVGGGYNVGWIVAGEWLKYQFTGGGGTYRADLRYATPYGGQVTVEVDGADVATLSFPSTGGWQDWATRQSISFYLSPGLHTVRLKMDTHNFNVNWIEFVATA